MELVAWPESLPIKPVPMPDWLLEQTTPAPPQATGELWAAIAGLILIMTMVWFLGRQNNDHQD